MKSQTPETARTAIPVPGVDIFGDGGEELNQLFSLPNLATDAFRTSGEGVWNHRGHIAGAVLTAGIGALGLTGLAEAREGILPAKPEDQDWITTTIQVLKTISVPTLVGAGNVARVRWMRGIEKGQITKQIETDTEDLARYEEATSQELAADAAKNNLNLQSDEDIAKYREAVVKQITDSLKQAGERGKRYSTVSLVGESATEFFQGYFATVLVLDVFNTIERAWSSANIVANLAETIDQGQRLIAWLYGAIALIGKAWELQNPGGGVQARTERATKQLRREGKIK